MTKEFICHSCKTALVADYSRGSSDAFLVACPKCGQRYKLRQPTPVMQSVQPPKQVAVAPAPLVPPYPVVAADPEPAPPPSPSHSPPHQTPPASKQSAQPARKPRYKIILIACLIVAALVGGIYGGIELSKRHTLTEAERAEAEGWFQGQATKQWLLLQSASDIAPGQSMSIARPSVSADKYGQVTVTVSIQLDGHSDEFSLGHFGATVVRPYTDLSQPSQLDLCDDNVNAGEGSCMTWRILNDDSMTVELRDDEGGSVLYSAVSAERFAALQQTADFTKNAALIHAIDSIAGDSGIVRRGAFFSYTCGDECGAAFIESRDGTPTSVTYISNNSRFGAVQLSQGDMLGKGDFTNPAQVGQSFLTISKAMTIHRESGDMPAWVILGVLPFSDEQMTPELQQRLAVSANLDRLTPAQPSVTSNTDAAVPPATSSSAVPATTQIAPSFPGGPEAMNAYLKKKLAYLNDFLDESTQGTVQIEFTVAESGLVEDARVKHGVNQTLDSEALKAVRQMPRWNPGTIGGKPTSVRLVIPVKFSSGEE